MNELEDAFYSALGYYGKNFFVDAKYARYSSLKAIAKLKGGVLTARVSDGFQAAPREALFGLALHLLGKMFNCKPEKGLVAPYREFVASRGAAELNHALTRRSGRKKHNRIVGKCYDLSQVVENVLNYYGEVFRGVRLPEFTWSTRKGRRVLGWHDDAWNRVTVNEGLDSKRVPPHVIEYVVFHEMLHAKHEVKHGKRRTVHTRQFREDEKKFFLKKEAEDWLQRKW
ncbi:hypothetical protein COX85_00210 [Candidatus Micrarchaeota archaeon CG_4_10_14_0_2_um_filter_55_9]|nr:MAG: hypothetical protein AUJ15_03185 [Candidatus Micrarchaeota archaeon CG1_02_55_41]PIO02995.1 MAG: hypothetical protein COT57_01335 [Candidatus Micrarchaeota archaeon CG09_land_8_20_14_0_10_55_25]PIZ92146.1 MAG: hypothetical protein COX85_00210 [Candidatus Micrarchaeota archaeon CG_4_10_14_0_2_um_filter_55_9]PJD01061.1 MAG: hypothetical protein COU38_03010 [Candidatus Micrarchaeota archaeon CG10_big_fil_rev_8_21_14_0_10_54_18]